MKHLHERFPAKTVSDATLRGIAARARSEHAKAASGSGAARSSIARSRFYVALKLWMAARNIGVLDLAALGAIAFIGVSVLGVQWHSKTNHGADAVRVAETLRKPAEKA